MERVKKLRDHTRQEVVKVGKRKAKYELKREEINGRIKRTMALVDQRDKISESLKKEMDGQMRVREVLNKSLVRADDSGKHMFDLLKIEENTKKNLSNEMNVFKANARRIREMIEAPEVDREKYIKECAESCAEAKQQCYTALEDVKLHDLQIAELNGKTNTARAPTEQQ